MMINIKPYPSLRIDTAPKTKLCQQTGSIYNAAKLQEIRYTKSSMSVRSQCLMLDNNLFELCSNNATTRGYDFFIVTHQLYIRQKHSHQCSIKRTNPSTKVRSGPYFDDY